MCAQATAAAAEDLLAYDSILKLESVMYLFELIDAQIKVSNQERKQH